MSQSAFPAHTVRVRGTELSFTDEGQGPPVLLVHGHAYDRSLWDAQVRTLVAGGWRALAPDLRGFGDSEVTEGIVYTEEFAADLAALLDALGLETVVLLGFSMGGQIAMQLLASHPERVRALVVSDTVPHAEDAAGRRRRHVTADRMVRDGMAAYASSVLPVMIREQNVERLPEVARAVAEMIRSAPLTGATAAMRGRAERADFTETLRGWDGPALVVVGSDDAFDGGAARTMAELLPRGELAVVPESGHTPNLENPAAYDAALLGFLDGLA
ncbi:alpha/beta fold hydrolase [Kocuria sp.]|uniref:alpha/beta fold hydrolase n=1 Tax=Kocuria sp. TaxID=1871328 RepID=UPI0026DD332F|nr:alpha/beta fold hydrolase [Kocuria sp.]MDO4920132.1 alpha/beta fold hydrolase [Kocuria sp.]